MMIISKVQLVLATILLLALPIQATQAYTFEHTSTFNIHVPEESTSPVTGMNYVPLKHTSPRQVHTYTSLQQDKINEVTNYVPIVRTQPGSSNIYQGITSRQPFVLQDHLDALRVFPGADGRIGFGTSRNTSYNGPTFGTLGNNAIRIGDNAIDWTSGKVGEVKNSFSEGGKAYNFSQDFSTKFKATVHRIKHSTQEYARNTKVLDSMYFTKEELMQPISQRQLVELLSKLDSTMQGRTISYPTLPIIGDVANEDTHYQYYVYVLAHGILAPSKATYKDGVMIYAEAKDIIVSNSTIAGGLSKVLGKQVQQDQVGTVESILQLIK